MGSSELFHFIPSPLSLSRTLVERPLILSFSRRAFHPTDRYNVPEALQWLFSRFLPHSSEKRKKKRGALPLSSPKGKRVEGVVTGVAAIQPPPLPQVRLWPCGPCLCPGLANRWKMHRMKQSFLGEPKWAEYETIALTQSTCLDYQPWYLIRD